MKTGKHRNPSVGTEIAAGVACPLPLSDFKNVLLAHGGGGKLTNELIERIIRPTFQNDKLDRLHDGAVFPVNGTRMAFSTDSFVVDPIFFPGGDIGELAVNGTVNDLAMCGATPQYLSVGLIIEEGLLMDDLHRIVRSMRNAADRAGVQLITGDTKVVDRGKADKIYINTSGVGFIRDGIVIQPDRATPGDVIIINGPIAEHGIAIMSVREGLEFETTIASDTAPLNGLVADILDVCPETHVLRDPTRGGIASALNEIATAAGAGMVLEQERIPISEPVQGACEILGFDPLYMANEGKVIVVVPALSAFRVLDAMQRHPLGRGAVVIGTVTDAHPGLVVMKTSVGGSRVVDMLSGEQLPRIC